MGHLVSLSLVTLDTANNVYHIHPLIQKWAREAAHETSIVSAAFLLALSINHEQHAEDCAFRRAMVFHVNEMLNLCATISSNDLWQFIAVLKEAGSRTEMLDLEVVKSRTHTLGHEHPATLESMENLSTTYREAGRLAEAEKLHIDIIAGQAKILGVDHPGTLRRIANLVPLSAQQHMEMEDQVCPALRWS